MRELLLFLALGVTLAGAVAVIAFERPTRSVGGLATAYVGACGVTTAIGAPLLPGALLWIGVGAVALLILASVIVLDLGTERIPRTILLRPGLGVLVLGFVIGPLFGVLGGPLSSAPTQSVAHGARLDAAAVSSALIGELGVPLGVAVVAASVAAMTLLGVLRRRA